MLASSGEPFYLLFILFFLIMFKSIATAAAVATTFVTVSPISVQAEVHEGGTIMGYYTPYIFESPNRSTYDTIQVEGPQGLETIKVRCAPFDWESNGPNTAQFVDAITKTWCF